MRRALSYETNGRGKLLNSRTPLRWVLFDYPAGWAISMLFLKQLPLAGLSDAPPDPSEPGNL